MTDDSSRATLGRLEEYWDDAAVILRHPYTFFQYPGFAGTRIFRRGLTLLLLSGAVIFLILAPPRWYHDQPASAGYYEAFSLVAALAFGLVLHGFLHVLGGRRSAKETVGAYAAYTAITSVLSVIVMYPS